MRALRGYSVVIVSPGAGATLGRWFDAEQQVGALRSANHPRTARTSLGLLSCGASERCGVWEATCCEARQGTHEKSIRCRREEGEVRDEHD